MTRAGGPGHRSRPLAGAHLPVPGPCRSMTILRLAAARCAPAWSPTAALPWSTPCARWPPVTSPCSRPSVATTRPVSAFAARRAGKECMAGSPSVIIETDGGRTDPRGANTNSRTLVAGRTLTRCTRPPCGRTDLRAGVVSRGYGRDAAGVCVAGPASTARDLGADALATGHYVASRRVRASL